MAYYSDPRETLSYEMWMLRKTEEELRTFPKSKHSKYDQLHIYNALLESFLLHARNLIRFFYPPKDPDDGDMLPEDEDLLGQAAGARWRRKHHRIPPGLAVILDAINRDLAHMSAERLGENTDFDEPTIRGLIDELFDDFNRFGPNGGAVVPAHPNL